MPDSPYETVTTTRYFFRVLDKTARFEIQYHGHDVFIQELDYDGSILNERVEPICFKGDAWVWGCENRVLNCFGLRYRPPADYMAAILDHINTHGIPKEIQKEMEESENS